MSILGKPPDKTRIRLTELNMTPMIDCVFLLLLFFMVGMKFKEDDRQLEARLPRQGPVDKLKPRPLVPEILLEIRNGGTAAEPRPRVLIDRRPMAGWDAARTFLGDLARHANGHESNVIVSPSDDAAHGWVMKALDMLTELGYPNVSFKR